jgi:hypothetical protein
MYLSAPVPSAGTVAYLSSNSSAVTVPSSVTVAGGATGFKFNATAALNTQVKQTATLTAKILTTSGTTAVTVDPTVSFQFSGNNTEMSLLATGASVTATTMPSDWAGTLTVRGNGYAAFNPVVNSNGVAFHNPGSQNTNTAFVNFSSSQGLGSVFGSAAEISFLLKSAYSFTERRTSTSPRMVFEVYDDLYRQYAFYSYISGGQLVFAYTVKNCTALFTVPAGQEDVLFGKDVVARIRIGWTGNTSTLYINDTVARTGTIMAKSINWTSRSAFSIGAASVRSSGGGYYASDDAIADFKVR